MLGRLFQRAQVAPRVECLPVKEGDTVISVRNDCICLVYGAAYKVHKDAFKGGACYIHCEAGVHYINYAEIDTRNPSRLFDKWVAPVAAE